MIIIKERCPQIQWSKEEDTKRWAYDPSGGSVTPERRREIESDKHHNLYMLIRASTLTSIMLTAIGVDREKPGAVFHGLIGASMGIYARNSLEMHEKFERAINKILKEK